jgi:beta-glucosidase/6-phospho-beta-glucosidase/beta-galactosidase
MEGKTMFASFFQAGFECSTMRWHDGRRLDITAATAHDRLAAQDYALIRSLGLHTARDGARWHLIEEIPGQYRWESFLPMLQAAQRSGTQIIWDLLHFGWPDAIDVFSPDFPHRFAAFAERAAKLIRQHAVGTPCICPVNEGSFLSWAGGDNALMNPMAIGRGHELKRQLARTAILAIEAIWSVDRNIRIIHADPVINVQPDPLRPETIEIAHSYNNAQFQFWDMISGRLDPELGGKPDYLDVVGINYYCHNQWIYEGFPLEWPGGGVVAEGQPLHPAYIPPAKLLERVFRRYGRPLFIAETGIEAELRPHWLRYVCDEVHDAILAGVPVEGICLYPVMNHPGWADDRHCPNGLIDYDRTTFERRPDGPMLAELQRQQARFHRLLEAAHPRRRYG